MPLRRWAQVHIGTGSHHRLLIRRNPDRRLNSPSACWSRAAVTLAELVASSVSLEHRGRFQATPRAGSVYQVWALRTASGITPYRLA